MKRMKKLCAVFISILILISCLTVTSFAAETGTQDGLTAVIQTDKDSYLANEDIHITITVKNTNTFEVKNVSIETFLPEGLTLKDGKLKSKTIDLKAGETLTLACVAILEKEEPTPTETETSETVTEETTTEITETTETTESPTETTEVTTETTEPTTEETTVSDTTESETEYTSEVETDDILPIEPSTNDSNTNATESVSQGSNPESPDTGDNTGFIKVVMVLITAIAVAAAIVIITKKNNKKATKVISLILCGAIAVSSFATVGFIKVGAEEGSRLSFSVDKSITVNGNNVSINSVIKYDESIIVDAERKYELKISPCDVLIEKDTTVLFTATCTTNKEDDIKLAVYDEHNNFITYLYDNGQNGDEIPNDGIYSANYNVYSEEVHQISYYIKDDENVISNTANIYFYRLFTDQEISDAETFRGEIKKIREKYADSEGYIDKKKIASYFEDVCNLCEKLNDIVESYSYSKENQSVSVTLKSGMTFGVLAPIKYYLSDGNAKKITTVVSAKQEFGQWWGEYLGRTPDEIANYIVKNTYGEFCYSQEEQLEDEKVGLDNLKKLTPFKVLIWKGHGGCIDSIPVLQTTTKIDKDSYNNYAADYQYNRIMCISDYWCITPEFIERYFPTLEDSIIYLGACSVLANHNLSDSLIAKGASAVYGYSINVYTWDENPICENLFKNLCSYREVIGGLKLYSTVSEAYADFENNIYGFVMHTDNPNARLIESSYNKNCNISGSVVDAETGSPLEASVTATSTSNSFTVKSSPETGNFSITDIPAGTYQVSVYSEGYENEFYNVELTPGLNYVFLDPIELSKTSNATVTGYVKDQSTNNAIEGVTVNAYDANGYGPWAASTTDSEGKFTLSFKDDGTYKLVFEKDGYSEQTRVIYVTSGVVTEPMQISLKPESRPQIDSGTCGENLTWVLYEDGELVISGRGEMDYYNDWDDTPWKNKKINRVTIESGVTTIGEAFSGCTSLKNIIIPDSVTFIITGAFENCTSLESITIPNSITRIGSYTFAGCISLKSIIIPNSVMYIDSSAFWKCENLTNITVPESVQVIGERAFGHCTSLKSIVISNGVGGIHDFAFSDCTSLTDITIPDSVIYVGDWAFSGCTSLENIIIPNSITEIKKETFSGCTNLKNITIPNSVAIIEGGAFRNCTSLESVTIPNSLTEFDGYTFAGCTSLKSIIIPESVTTIYGFFDGCSNLESVTILNKDCIFPDFGTITPTNTIIYGYTGSTAETYAKKYGRKFISLD